MNGIGLSCSRAASATMDSSAEPDVAGVSTRLVVLTGVCERSDLSDAVVMTRLVEATGVCGCGGLSSD